MTEFRELSERYQLKKILRSTRFGSVLQATDSSTGQAVAIKLIPIATPERLQEGESAFLRFAAALRTLRHPNLPLVSDSGFTTDGSAFLTLEWLDGEPIASQGGAGGPGKQGEIAVGRAIAWVLRALNGLEALAHKGVAHHNLTPDNLFLAHSPDGGTIKLLGLGSALFRPRGSSRAIGWPPEAARFQAPELGGSQPAASNDPRVDIYALARIACDLLGATIPLGDDPPVQLPLAVSFELENEALLRRVLEGALRRDPAARPGPRELREALQTAVTGMSAQPEVNPLDGTMADLATPSILDAGPLFVEGPAVSSPTPSIAQMPPATPLSPAAPVLSQDTAPQYLPPAGPPASSLPWASLDETQGIDSSLNAASLFGAPPKEQAFAPLPPPPADDLLPLFESMITVEDLTRSAPFSAAPATDPTFPPLPADYFAPPDPPAPPAPPPARPPAAPAAPPKAALTPAPPAVATPPREPATPPPAAPPAAAPPPTSGLPDNTSPEPGTGEVLQSIDDEMFNALLAVPAAPQPAPAGKPSKASRLAKVVPFSPRAAGAPQGRAAGTPPQPGGPSLMQLLRKPAVFGSLVGAVLLLGGGLYWAFHRTPPEPPAAPPSGPVVKLPPPPSEPPLEQLEEAQRLLAQGDDLAARRVLQGISYAQQGLLPEGKCRELAAIETILSAAGMAQLPVNLAQGLEKGELRRLQQAVAAAEDQGKDLSLAPEAQQNLERAREVVKTYGAAQAALASGAFSETLQQIAGLRKALPKLEDPEKLRDKAAAGLENEAEALARDAHYDQAVAKLDLIKASWPERPGLDQRRTAMANAQKSEQEQTAILAGMNAFERRRKPQEGLEAMKGVVPTPHLAAQFQAARQRLEDLLARLDQQPPRVTLRDGFYLEFQRGNQVEVSFRVTDDYQVNTVKMMARGKGGTFREVRLTKSAFGYSIQVQPPLHHNADVEFYVVATDLSGHEGYFGTPSEPKVLKLQRGFERAIR